MDCASAARSIADWLTSMLLPHKLTGCAKQGDHIGILSCGSVQSRPAARTPVKCLCSTMHLTMTKVESTGPWLSCWIIRLPLGETNHVVWCACSFAWHGACPTIKAKGPLAGAHGEGGCVGHRHNQLVSATYQEYSKRKCCCPPGIDTNCPSC